jgi:hypothetical protein
MKKLSLKMSLVQVRLSNYDGQPILTYKPEDIDDSITMDEENQG